MEKSTLNAALAGLFLGVEDLAHAAGETPGDSWAKVRPEEIPTELVSQARQLAAGCDLSRMATPEQLLSPFGGLYSYNVQSFLPLQALNPLKEKDIFPSPHKAQNPAVKIAALWKKMDQTWKLEKPDDAEAQIEALLALLQQYAWCVPSNAAGVSVYDLARTTAAIATCLVARGIEIAAEAADSPVGLLVSGDFSGLQKFLYTLASAGAAKSLRARSVYLQWVAEAVVFSLLNDLGLPLSSLLYVGGGGFQFLAPLGADKELPELVADLTDRLLKLHNGELGLTLAWGKLTQTDFTDFGSVRARLGEKLNRNKRRPFSGVSLTTLQNTISQPITEGGDPLIFCQVTGEDGSTVTTDKDGEYKSKFVIDLEKLGLQLPHARYLVFTVGDKANPVRAVRWQQALSVFGFHAHLVTDKNEPVNLPSGLRSVWRLKPEAIPIPAGLGEAVNSYRPFAQLTAWNVTENRPKTFDELAAHPLRGGFERWGVLRLDVDNLGMLFKEGFGPKVGIAYTAGLSFALRLFFEGWLPQLVIPDPKDPLAKDDLSDYLYLQYSGGDDIFIVGTWDALPEFARRVRQSLGIFTAHNPNVTLSGGIELFCAKFPLYQAAQRAGNAEHAAKNYKYPNGKEKDAITFLGQTMGWESFEKIQRQAYRMADLIDSGALSRGALQAILALTAQIEAAIRQNDLKQLRKTIKHKKGKFLYGSWTWMAAYQLTRMKPSVQAQRIDPKKKEVADLLTNIQRAYLEPKYQEELHTHGLSARWAQFLTRGGN